MADLRFDVPEAREVEVDEETLAELKRRIDLAKQGRTYSIEEVREMIPKWLAKFASQTPR